MKSNKKSKNNITPKDINTQKNDIDKKPSILSESYSLKMLDYMIF